MILCQASRKTCRRVNRCNTIIRARLPKPIPTGTDAGASQSTDNCKAAHPKRPPPHNPTRPTYVPVDQMTPTRVQQRRRRQAIGLENWAWVVIAVALLGMTVIVSMVNVLSSPQRS